MTEEQVSEIAEKHAGLLRKKVHRCIGEALRAAVREAAQQFSCPERLDTASDPVAADKTLARCDCGVVFQAKDGYIGVGGKLCCSRACRR